MTCPSKFIFNSDYKSIPSDANTKLQIVLPDSFIVPAYSTQWWFDRTIKIGSNSTIARITVMSSKYGSATPCSAVFSVPAHYSSAYGSGDGTINFSINRSNTGEFRLRSLLFNGTDSPTTWSGMGQTLTISIATFLTPFDA